MAQSSEILSVNVKSETENCGNNGGDQVTYFSEGYCHNLRENIHLNFNDGLFSDVTICVGDQRFQCHRVILASGTNYFRSMFASGMQEAHKDVIEMKDLDADIFARTIKFIYTGKVTISMETVCEQYRQAYVLQIYQLVELCTDYFTKNISLSNCLGMLMLADTYSHEPLLDATIAFVCKNFNHCRTQDDFLDLSVDCMVSLLRNRNLCCQYEDSVFMAAMAWLDHDSNRSVHKFKILKCVKFPLLTESYLMDTVVKSSIAQGDDSLNDILEDAVTFHTIPSRRNMLNPYQVTPRYSFAFFEAAVLLGGRYSEGLRNDVECFRPDTGEFFSLKTLPFKKRNEFAVCSVGNEIYVSGGLRSAEFWKYDTTFDTWVRGLSLNYPRRRHAMVSVDDTIFVLGGFDEDKVLGSIEKWNRRLTKWEECGSLSLPVENMGSVSYGQKIYLFGGKNNDEQVTNTIQYFDSQTNTCTVLGTSLPAHDMCVSAVVLLNEIYVVGLEGVFRFNPTSENWKILPETNFPRDFISLAVMDEKIYAIGGRRRGSKENLYSDCVEYYDIKTNKWLLLNNLPQPMYCYGCTKVYLCDRPSNSDTYLEQSDGMN